MNEYINEIEKIASKCTCSQSDGYSQIMRICEAMKEQEYCLGYRTKGEIKSPSLIRQLKLTVSGITAERD